MNCTEARKTWMLYLDSEGDPQSHLQVSQHLGRCPACAEWFARQQQLEDAVRDRLAAGNNTAALWDRVLGKAGLLSRPRFGSRRRLGMGGLVAASAVLLVAFLGWPWGHQPPPSDVPELAQDAAELHKRWLDGQFQPDFASMSELDVDRYFKANAPFKVHCPPRSNVNFSVQGAAVRSLRDRHKAGFIVGRVGTTPVSILVLDRSSLAAFPHDQARLAGGGRHRCQEGGYQMASAVLADNVVVVIGNTRPETLETLLDAYGSYH
jgi:hypothetical protein